MSKRPSQIRRDEIEYAFCLIFDDTGGVRLTRNQGSLARNERSMAVVAKLPITLFQTPSLRAQIGVNGAPPRELKIDIEAASTALRNAIGVDVDLRVIPPGDEQ